MKHLDALSVGEAAEIGGLTVWPLLALSSGDAFATLDAALASGTVELAEVSGAGVVGELRVTNGDSRPLFLLDGEQVLGLKQNRTFNLSMIVPAGQSLVVPVSCLELGRWARVPTEVRAARHVHFASGRARKVASVSQSLRRTRSYASDQAQVWHDISSMCASHDVASSTEAEADLFEALSDRIDSAVSAMPVQADQVGAAFAVGGRLVGIDVFASTALFAALAPQLFRSYAAEVVDSPLATSAKAADITALLEQLTTSSPQRFPAPGAGETLRWETGAANAAALVVDDVVVHLAAFPA